MPTTKGEKILGAAIDETLLDDFEKASFEAIGHKFKKKKLMTAFARWWLDLGPEDKKRFYALSEAKSLSELFKPVVEQQIRGFLTSPAGVVIIGDVIAERHKAQTEKRTPRRSKSR